MALTLQRAQPCAVAHHIKHRKFVYSLHGRSGAPIATAGTALTPFSVADIDIMG